MEQGLRLETGAVGGRRGVEAVAGAHGFQDLALADGVPARRGSGQEHGEKATGDAHAPLS
jgi:hypothetical protein